MAIEIERKFLLKDDSWRRFSEPGTDFCQGYLCDSGPGSVRIRIEGNQANINIKSATLDMQRLEYEYSIPIEDAREMLDQLCIKPLIEKKRYHVNACRKLWEIDVFEGDNKGLIVAEVELESRDEFIEMPEWVGEEVTEDTRYYNVCLVKHPYKDWDQ
ncbi:MAG: CYTH domain-containing protein [Gammaproteobacteria bacterium]|nr:CYTH domain-containing protein [Gammaproteobacteria bacterium]